MGIGKGWGMLKVRDTSGQSENFVDLLAEQARLYGDKTAFAFLEDGENVTDTVSFARMVERAHAVAVEDRKSVV